MVVVVVVVEGEEKRMEVVESGVREDFDHLVGVAFAILSFEWREGGVGLE